MLKDSVQIKGGYNPEAAVKRGMKKYFKIQHIAAFIQALRTATASLNCEPELFPRRGELFPRRGELFPGEG